MALFVVLGKELRETFRDANTLLMTVLFPLFFYPGMAWFALQAVALVEGELEGWRARVSAPAEVAALLPADVDVVEGDADVTVTLDGGQAVVRYRSVDPSAERARRVVEKALLAPLDTDTHNLAPRRERTAATLAGALPGAIVVLALFASLYPAVEAVVAERERGTRETSLVTAAPRWALFAGKLGAVMTMVLLSLVANVAAAALTAGHIVVLLDGDLALPPLRVLAVVPMAVVAALFGAAASLVAALPARDFKQAQNAVTLVSVVGGALATWGMLPRTDLDLTTALVPLTNAVLVMREGLLGRPVGVLGWIAAGELMFLAAVAVAVAARVAAREGRG